MSSNPFEQALWIDIGISRGLHAIFFFLIAATTASLCLAAIPITLKCVLLVVLYLYAWADLSIYGAMPLSHITKTFNCRFLRGYLERVKRAPIVGVMSHQQSWQIRFADGKQISARLLMPVSRWRYFLLLRFELLNCDAHRHLSLLVTPWQIHREQFRILYARLGWVTDARQDG